MARATRRRTGQPDADEAPAATPPAACLFPVPAHMRNRFWAMLNEEAAEGTGDFDEFSEDLANFLTFKELPPPKDSVCELLIQESGWKGGNR